MKIKSLINLFFPEVCVACKDYLSDNETFLCTNCRHQLPTTNFHVNNDNFVKNVFYGRAKLEAATALLRFEKKGMVQHLLHQLKYGNNEDISRFFGDWLGEELKLSNQYNDIDLVIPVPLHSKKLKKRGYNQVTQFGQKIAKALNTSFSEDLLIKITNTETSQASKSRLERWQLDNETFSVTQLDTLNNKHILLVDDIITTGNTLEACILELNKAHNIKISIAAMAIA
ncbi:phosphoribosyltransferase family protein [Olleya sp. YS]|uniref:ComF family protein n=1 Tax=Olleya sp. YS TaxID=3028318 RepID=UPI0024345D8A|nr:phosphoribosyltransferase family protein [Olleya sp. YS]WGD35579.1 phosphoribosyltransferase family protein [Olleya sp. YS]